VAVGDRVRHRSWGIGRVVSLAGEGNHAEAMVEFEEAGRKRLLLAWAPLERVL
jgi:DNA helicase-2/ATP-dependent DNA helicase PcrA